MKHTHGPWSVGHMREQRVDKRLAPMWELPVHVGDSANRGNALAIVYIGGPGAITNSEAAVEANGRLIAAAPDLYATLEYIIEALEMRAREHDCKGIHCSTCNPMELVEMGREAIAKADERNTAKVAP